MQSKQFHPSDFIVSFILCFLKNKIIMIIIKYSVFYFIWDNFALPWYEDHIEFWVCLYMQILHKFSWHLCSLSVLSPQGLMSTYRKQQQRLSEKCGAIQVKYHGQIFLTTSSSLTVILFNT